jgi:predicted ATPase/DNA-binding XRE family transcriptional regulator
MTNQYRLPEFSPGDALEDVAAKLRAHVFRSQAQAANTLPVDRSTIARYESGYIVAPWNYLVSLAKLISDAIEVEGQTVEQIRRTLLQEMEKVRRRFHREERPLKEWAHLESVALSYLAGTEHRRAGDHPVAPKKDAEPLIPVVGPTPPTSFIGREQEKAQVAHLLTTARLVTLTGPGGTGKTRLALEVASHIRAEYPGGVWVAYLETLSDPELVLQRVALAMGVREEPDQPLMSALSEHMRGKRCLLLLDNFEQVAPAARLVAQLLSEAQDLRVLVTSRTPLRLRGEQEYPVLPMKLPNLRRLPPAERLMEYEAVRLFVTRAREARPDFGVTEENTATLAEICHRLDGLPLAIELAAAHIKILPPQAMLKRLRECLKLLVGGPLDSPARQQTLRDTIDWSYGLLAAGEQLLFRRLSVFTGSFALDEAEAVCNTKLPEQEPQPNMLQGLAALVDKSLLRPQDATDEEPRFFMLQTIREYARERLAESGEENVFLRTHTTAYQDLAETTGALLRGPQQEAALERLEREHDNLRAALERSLGWGDVETAARLAGALWRFWLMFGYLSEGRSWLEKILTHSQHLPEPLRAKVAHGAGVLAANQGEYEAARHRFEEAAALYRTTKDVQGIADVLNSLGLVLAHEGSVERAQAILQESLALQRALGSSHGIAVVLHNLGMLAHDQGDSKIARPLYEESLALARSLGDQEGTAWALNGLGQLALDEGHYDQALLRYGESLALCQGLGDKMGLALCLERLAGVATAQGQAKRAAVLFGGAQALRELMGSYMEPSYREAHEHTVAKAREQLDIPSWNTAWEEGKNMPLEQVLAYATEEVGRTR